jgi:TonB family protein
VDSILHLRYRLLTITSIAMLCICLPAAADPTLAGVGTAGVKLPAASENAVAAPVAVDAQHGSPSHKVAALASDLHLPLPVSDEEARQKLEWELSLKIGKHRRQDDYPENARLQRWSGTVLVRVLVDGAGLVKEVTLARTSGFQVLDEQALMVVRRVPRVFMPLQLRGHSREVSVPIGFYLATRS